ncbi:hypothetical protein K443DRAFT_685477 [Laccaria amethystina LaAM-08-1]|uniref:Uncharacterized protein n=1 Tax=Laccaria amethystina LaAM-08-1 TaxID=1095629 RepID=A0A0C9X344_9AGAR|nr:hypothetical protein K443DRAFT_685477 [Laccaria amethystina LaAM-08-1]
MIRRLSLHRHLEKKKLEVIKGVEDHVKFAPVTLNTALEVIRRKGESALFREERFSWSPLRLDVDLHNRGEGRVEVC